MMLDKYFLINTEQYWYLINTELKNATIGVVAADNDELPQVWANLQNQVFMMKKYLNWKKQMRRRDI